MHTFAKTLLSALVVGCLGLSAAMAESLALARNGKTNYTLLLPANPLPTETKAAEELQFFLHKITGADFKIVRENQAYVPPVISIGKTALAQKEQPKGWTHAFSPEGAGIAVKNGNLFLFGGKQRGPLYATYLFLEEDLGCRWYPAEREIIPLRSTLTVAIESRTSDPVFSVMRDPASFYSSNNGTPTGPEFTLRNRGNGVFSGIPNNLGGFFCAASYQDKWWFAHTYNNILAGTPENLKKYPECFMMDENGKRVIGQLCPLSPMVRQKAAEMIIATMKHSSGEVNLSQNDAVLRCHCPQCEALIAREGTTAAPHLTLVNYVAEQVKKAGITDRKIIFLGYQQTRKPPLHMKMAANTALWLCTDIQSQAKYIPVEKNPEFVANLQQWKKAVSTIYIWDYYVNFNNYFAYEPSLYSMAQNLKFYAKNGVTGVMLQGALATPGAALEDISSWCFEKLLWNPNQPIEPLMDDYLDGVYGPASPAMKKLYFRIYEMGKAGRGGPENAADFDFFEANCLQEARDLLKRNHRADLLPRVELAAVPLAIRNMNKQSVEAAKAGKPYSPEFRRQLADFAAMAQREKITHYSEGIRLDQWLAQIKKRDGIRIAGEQKIIDFQGSRIEVNKLFSLWKFKAFPLLTTPEEIQREAVNDVKVQLNTANWDDYLDNLGVGWEAQGYPGYIGTAVFRNTIELPAELKYRYYNLFFGSVDCESVIYVNGVKAFEHTLKSTGMTIYNLWNHPFGAEIKKYLHGGQNTVAVICTNHGSAGGIYMPVFLVGSDRKLNRKELYHITGSRHPYALDDADEIAKELKK